MQKSIGTSTFLGVVCLALMPLEPVHAANWVYVGSNTADSHYYYDSDTIQRSGNQVVVWHKADHSQDKTVKERESKARYRYDCAMRSRVLLQVTNYYPDGNVETFTWETYEQKVQYITPDTMGESMLEAVCR